MKFKIIQALIIASSLTTSVVAQQEQDETLNAINNRFSNLPLEVRKNYFQLKKDAYRYFKNKRLFESMMTVFEMFEIFDEDPQAYNLLGSIHIEFRDFNRARTNFNKALNTSKSDNIILFNLAEIEFCSSNWERSLTKFKQLKTVQTGQINTEIDRLIDLKIMLCHLALADPQYTKIDQSKKTSHLASAQELSSKYTYLDDSPYFYYAQASLAFFDNDTDKAKEWLSSARTVFRNNPTLLASWTDTFIEFGYIDSHYGTEQEEKNTDGLLK